MTTARDSHIIKEDSGTAILAVFSRAGSPCHSEFEKRLLRHEFTRIKKENISQCNL